ncbi:hypothetical protein EJB05_14106, partial [Eragrostis curvula]
MYEIHIAAEGSGQRIVLMAIEDGRLGFTIVHQFKLYLWSKEIGPGGDERWVQSRVIELEALLPAGASAASPRVIVTTDSAGIVFMTMIDGLFTFDRLKKREGHAQYIGYKWTCQSGHIDTTLLLV